jgi:hypothetical protein
MLQAGSLSKTPKVLNQPVTAVGLFAHVTFRATKLFRKEPFGELHGSARNVLEVMRVDSEPPPGRLLVRNLPILSNYSL